MAENDPNNEKDKQQADISLPAMLPPGTSPILSGGRVVGFEHPQSIPPIGQAMVVPSVGSSGAAPTSSAAMPNPPAMPGAPPTFSTMPNPTGSRPTAMPMDNPGGIPIQPEQPARPAIQLPTPEKPAIQKLADKAAGIDNPFARILARTGTGILSGLEGLGEAAFPSVAMMIPGSEMHTALDNRRAERRAESEQAMQSAQQKAMTKRKRPRLPRLAPKPKRRRSAGKSFTQLSKESRPKSSS
jgi:hypothetical protein